MRGVYVQERQEEQEAHVRYLQARLREAQEGLAAAARRHATLEELAGQQVKIDSVSSGLGQTDHLMACLRVRFGNPHDVGTQVASGDNEN